MSKTSLLPNAMLSAPVVSPVEIFLMRVGYEVAVSLTSHPLTLSCHLDSVVFKADSHDPKAEKCRSFFPQSVREINFSTFSYGPCCLSNDVMYSH